MAGMIISIELRPCVVIYANKVEKALFHTWANINNNTVAIVEFESGEVGLISPHCLQFRPGKFADYDFNIGAKDNPQ